MISALVILTISFLAMITMLIVKHYELKAGKLALAVGPRKWIENKAHQSAYAARGVVHVSVTKHFWTSLASFVADKFVEKVWHHPRVRTVTKKAADVVKGKKEIKSKGPVSFYLKDVSDYKNHVRSL